MSSILGPVVSAVCYVFIACLVLVWVLSVFWARKDAKSRGFNLLAATLMAIVPFIGVVAYMMIRPSITLDEKEELELGAALIRLQLRDYKKCPTCSYDILSSYVVCPKCQTKLNELCDNCGKVLDIGWRACPYCGTPKHIDDTFADIPLDIDDINPSKSNAKAHRGSAYTHMSKASETKSNALSSKKTSDSSTQSNNDSVKKTSTTTTTTKTNTTNK